MASPDIVGPIRNGGVGTAYLHISRILQNAGHEITVLYTNGDYTETEPIAHWVSRYREMGLELAPLPRSAATVRGSAAARVSHTVYRWLCDRPFDVIHFPEMRGHGYYTILAKRQGIAFENTRICVGAYGPTLWHKLSNAEYLDRLEDLEHDFLERKSIEFADVVISPSQYLLNWMRDRGWTPPERSYIWPNPLWPPGSASVSGSHHETKSETAAAKTIAVREWVFFGRLEDRKGIVLFCDALDRLVSEKATIPTVTFLGKEAGVEGMRSLDYLRSRATRWSFSWRALTDRDHRQALDYLREPGAGRVALMPSRADNSPFTVLESLNLGIPFLASDVGGIPELIVPEDRDRVLFAWRADRFADKLKTVLREGLAPARLIRPMSEIARVWADWHRVAADRTILDSPSPANPPPPRISVCVPTRNRPQLLKQALESIRHQDYPHFEVILVDDGSDDPEALRALDELQPEFNRKGWTILREPNRYPAAARNTAARRARGEYLFFMDDDNLAKPSELSTLARVAERTSADVLTAFHHIFQGDEPPDARATASAPLKLFLGDAVNLGVMSNVFGDTNALFRREAFWRIGGFTEDYGINHEDWELFAKAALRGLKLMVVPEPLYWYRETAGSVTEVTPSHANHMRCLRPYLDAVPPELRELIFYCQGLKVGRPLAYKIVDQANAMLERMPKVRRIAAKAMRSAVRWGRRLQSARRPR